MKTLTIHSKVRAIALFMMMAFLVLGCEGIYETYPKDELLEEDFWKNQSDVEAAIMTGYYDLRQLQDELILYGLVRSDIAYLPSSTYRNWQKGIFASTDRICQWGEWYKLINDMNVVLTKSEAVMALDEGFTVDKYNQLMGEARFLRAFAYFNMIRMWKNVPIVDQPSLSDNQDYFPAKSKNPQLVLDFIRQDLDFATQHMVSEYFLVDEPERTSAMNRGRATRGAAYALLSDVLLYQNDYEGCIAACDKVLNNPMYRLLSKESWWDIFAPQKGNTAEAIFELNYEENYDFNNRHNESNYKLSLEEWFKNQIYAQPISVLWPPPDIRYNTLTGSGGRWVRKHAGADWSSDNLIGENLNPNWIIYRLPHIMFNKAEALNRARGDAALSEINAMVSLLEQRAGSAEYEPIVGSKVEVEEHLLRYKLKETAFEGTRWFDLVRIGKRQWAENMTGDQNILVKSLTEAAFEEDKIFIQGNLNNPEAWYIPISRSELESNPNLEQNPYYINN